MIEAQTAFLVVVDKDGVISTYSDVIPQVTVERTATPFDIETYCSQIVRSVERGILAQTLVSLLKPHNPPSASDLVTQALEKRLSEQVTEE